MALWTFILLMQLYQSNLMKYLFTILLFLISFSAFSQAIQNRSNSIVTVQDARWKGLLNAFLPIYNDTTAANLQKGIDSPGAVILTRDVNFLWYRTIYHGWAAIGSNAPAQDSIFFVYPLIVNGNTVYMNPASLIKTGGCDVKICTAGSVLKTLTFVAGIRSPVVAGTPESMLGLERGSGLRKLVPMCIFASLSVAARRIIGVSTPSD